jgi:hypothetical protein
MPTSENGGETTGIGRIEFCAPSENNWATRITQSAEIIGAAISASCGERHETTTGKIGKENAWSITPQSPNVKVPQGDTLHRNGCSFWLHTAIAAHIAIAG